MRHTNFKNKQETYTYISKTSNDVDIYKFTVDGGLSLIKTVTPTAINGYFKVTDTLPNEDCFYFVLQEDCVPQIMRVGDPIPLVIAYTGKTTGCTYEQYDLEGNLLSSGNMVSIGLGFYYVDPSVKSASFFVIEGIVKTFVIPYKIINVDTTPTGITTDKNFINVGYNMFGFLGDRHSYFDLSIGKWIQDDNITAKASDIAKAITHKYGLVWDDRTHPNWIGNYVKYIRTYVENEQSFKYYSPSITPETNTNNFELVQIDEDGNYYVRGISILLLQPLETINNTDGAIITFRSS